MMISSRTMKVLQHFLTWDLPKCKPIYNPSFSTFSHMTQMTSSHTVKVLQCCQISPPQGSVPSTTIPLTFFDIPWLLFTPNQPLFFYDFPHFSTHDFIHNILPNLKHSLSSTLQYFFPLAGNLVIPPQPSKPHLSYAEGDSVSLIIAESSCDFAFLSSYQPINVQDFYHLVPQLTLSMPVETTASARLPLLAVQITIFPRFGVCMGFALRQVAADGRTFDNFLKTWASILGEAGNKCPPLALVDNFLPCNERSLIHDPSGLELIFLKQWWHLKGLQKDVANGSNFDEIVRATFVVGPIEMEKIKGWIMTRSMNIFGSTRLYLSPYVVTCAFVWVCWTKIHLIHGGDFPEKPHYFGFIAGGITRLGFSVPKSYIGNCVAFGRSMVKRDQLVGENGLIYAAKAIGDTIKELDREVLGEADKWISDWEVLFGSEPHVMITGSPKVGSYELDFGWGRPTKVEEASISKTRAISLCESRDVFHGIEVGLALPKAKMDAFDSLFREGLKTL
nr:coumaroyl-CoA:anthocyanidin 3-O-glucoside-6''-O-coumaroyltransferase 2-like [Coffea arabica]